MHAIWISFTKSLNRPFSRSQVGVWYNHTSSDNLHLRFCENFSFLLPLYKNGDPFLEAPAIITGPVKMFCFSIPDESLKKFESCTVKLSAKETKWTSL